MTALPYAAVTAFVQGLRTAPDTRETIRLALELLILTATRTSEVQQARWPEVNLETRTWTIPGIRMKSGRDHRIPLCDRAVEIFPRMQDRAISPTWIFPGHDPTKPLSNMTFLKASRRLTIVPLTPHGFRSSFRDWCEERTNFPTHGLRSRARTCGQGSDEAAYKRTDLFDRRRDLMDLWARFVTATPAAVVAIA
jgi:integrase